jgi:Methyltransferase domain
MFPTTMPTPRGVDRSAAVSSPDSVPWLKAAVAVVVTNFFTLTLCRQYQSVSSWFTQESVTVVRPSSSVHHEDHSPSTTLAFQHSLGFFDDIDDDVWLNVYQRNFRSTPHYLNSQDPNGDVYKDRKTAHWQYYNWIPNFSCP